MTEEFLAILNGAGNFGVAIVIAVVFVWYFLQKAKGDDARVKAAYDDYKAKIEEGNKALYDREDMLRAENTKREELLRQEAEKRENLIRKEAEKRESILMANQDRMMDSLDKISDSMEKIQIAMSSMEKKHESDIGMVREQIGKLESKIDKIGGS